MAKFTRMTTRRGATSTITEHRRRSDVTTWAQRMNARDQIEILMNDLLPFAKRMLATYGEFHPFAGYLNGEGTPVHVGIEPPDEDGKGQQELDLLVGGLTKILANGDAIGVAVVTNVTLAGHDGGREDAIRCYLEHKDGFCAEVFFRYRLSSERVLMREVTAQESEPIFFDCGTKEPESFGRC